MNEKTGIRLKSILKISLKSWTSLLCFEILYKIIGFNLLFDLMSTLAGAVLKAGKQDYISQENLAALLVNPKVLLLLLPAFTVIVYYVYFEIAALILYCEAGWQGRHIRLSTLGKKVLRCSLSVFHYKNLPVILLLLPVIALSSFPLTSGFLSRVRIPEFIKDSIGGNSLQVILLFAGLTVLNLLLFFYLFAFPAVILQGKRYFGSLRFSLRLLKGRKWKTAMLLFTSMAAVFSAAFLGFCLMVLGIWAFCRWTGPADGGRGLFAFYFSKWSGMWTVALHIFIPLSLCAVIIILYHRYLGEEPPQPIPERATKKEVAMRVLSIGTALTLLTFYSEMIPGKNLTSPEDTAVVAHRAGGALGPENTVAALNEAVKAGADMAEIDVQQTRDGVLIILHDNDFRRTTGFAQKVRDTDFDTVRKLDAGSFYSAVFAGEPVPTLQEMLVTARGRIPLMIELKSSGHGKALVKETLRQIEAAGMTGQCVIASMNLELLRKSKELNPAIRTVYITALLFASDYDLRYVDGYSVETGSLTAAMTAQLHAGGKQVYAWTANRDESMRKILSLGADGLVTDNPALARYVIGTANEDPLLLFLLNLLYS